MSLSLPAIIKKASELALALIESGGELTPELEIVEGETSSALAMKVDSYGYVMDELDARREFIKVRMDQLKQIITSIDRAEDAMKSRIDFAMTTLQVSELAGDETRFTKQLNPPKLVLSNREMIPNKYFVQPPTPPPAIDTDAIKNDLKNGVEIQGAHLERGVSIRRKVATATKSKKAVTA
jgi:hypothetical protein